MSFHRQLPDIRFPVIFRTIRIVVLLATNPLKSLTHGGERRIIADLKLGFRPDQSGK
jgi:hypothetical protein